MAVGEVSVAPARGQAWPWVLLAARVVVGGLFLIAAWGKIRNPTAFAGSIESFQLLHSSIALEFGLLMIWLEVLCGALLVLGAWARAAAWVAGGMLALFFVAMASAVARGLDIDCGCFGALMAGGVGWVSLLRTLALLALAGLVAWRGAGRFSLGRP